MRHEFLAGERNNVRPIVPFVLLAISLASSQAAASKLERDESLATRSLYCADVNQYWVTYFAEHDPKNARVTGYRYIGSMFQVVAKELSDDDFVAKERPAALQKVNDILDRPESERAGVMDTEAKNCHETFQRQVVPLLLRNKPME
ncbi:MAG TPA: hypothetical protein VHB46_11130 [Burkholderiales bacterium]|nr:hypothetical protein [Burkholderiales bacterium]